MNTATGTIEHLDPTTLVIEANVRSNAPITAEFITSIRENGVLTPVLARRDEHGYVIVRAGQRRTLAAREAQLATIPVYVIDADEKSAERIVQQIVENDQRTELTTADRTAAWAQLAFEGVTPATIAKRTGTKTATIKAGLAVAESAVVTEVLHEHELTLDQAAVLLDFQDDADARDQLVQVATTDPRQFAHTAQRLRDEQERQARIAQVQAEHAERGFQILDRADASDEGTAWVRMSSLRTSKGEWVTVEHISEAPARGVIVETNWGGEVSSTYFVQDVDALGFTYAHGAPAAPDTDEEKAAKSAERRILLANNKAWAASEKVRRAWVSALLSRKTLPKDTDRAIALGLSAQRFAVSSAMGRGNELAHTLLGIEQPTGYNVDALTALVESNAAKSRLVSLAVVLAGQEANTSKESWRRGDERTAVYFRQLAAWGYDLSPVEQIVTGDVTPADAAGLS